MLFGGDFLYDLDQSAVAARAPAARSTGPTGIDDSDRDREVRRR